MTIDAVIIDLARLSQHSQVTYLQKDPDFKNPIYYGVDRGGSFSYEGFTVTGEACFIGRKSFSEDWCKLNVFGQDDKYPEHNLVNAYLLSEIFKAYIYRDNKNFLHLDENLAVVGDHLEKNLATVMVETGLEISDDTRKNIDIAINDIYESDVRRLFYPSKYSY